MMMTMLSRMVKLFKAVCCCCYFCFVAAADRDADGVTFADDTCFCCLSQSYTMLTVQKVVNHQQS